MPKSKTQPAKVKKTATKYPKLLVVAEKELENEKKALVCAERALQKAKQRHEEIIANIARLDMLARSLKAFVEGTEPPTNVRYVYNYPQWVWAPTYTYPNYTQPDWTYTPSYTINCQNSNLTGSNLTGSNLTGNNSIPNGGTFVCTTTTNALTNGNAGLVDLGQYSLSNMATMTTTADSNVTIDLSTHAEVVEPEYLQATANS